MSGTSCDGVDLAYCHFFFNATKGWSYAIKKSITLPYEQVWHDRLSGAINLSTSALAKLNRDYTALLNNFILNFIKTEQIEYLDLVCSHGHTVLHQPQCGKTLQIGNLEYLAKDLPCPVICDFRVQDVTLGGQGAPLVPIGDKMLFGHYQACLNLGGFANVSYSKAIDRLNEDDSLDHISAFDITPLNIVLNHFARQLGADYDCNGAFAESGQIHQGLVSRLNSLEYYKRLPPKSLGLEWVLTNLFPIFDQFNLSPQDYLATVSRHMAYQIESICMSFDRVLVTGGGAFNKHLMNELKSFSSSRYVVPPSQLVMYKEALIFGFLGLLRWRNEINCLSSVTGARRDHSSGVIWYRFLN